MSKKILKVLKIVLFVAPALAFLFLIVSEARIASVKTIHYRIEAGQQNFKPAETLVPFWYPKGFNMYAVFDSSAWWSPEDWEGDKDYSDWNKLQGLTNYLSANNRQTIMFAWRPVPRAYTIEVAPYINFENGDWTTGPPILVECGKPFTARVSWYSSEAIFNYQDEINYSYKIKRPTVARLVGTWIGGANNAPGKYGGKATQPMSLAIEFQVK